MKLSFVALIALTMSAGAFAQSETSVPTEKKFGLKTPDFKLESYAQIQGWGVYSMNRASQNDNDAGLDKADQRANFFFRRARLGFRGKPYKNLTYTLSMFYDNAGHDSMSATRNATNAPVSDGKQTDVTKQQPDVGLWDFFLTWKLTSSDMFHLTGGYLRPQISRESLTAAFNVNSFEKAPSQNYIRQSVIGRGFGRATGVNLGGMTENKNNFGIRYNVGVFNKVTTGNSYNGGTATTSTAGETQGSENSLVYVGRMEFVFGDPEMDKYGLGLKVNYFGKRKGLSIGLNGSTQERTPKYKANKVVGIDWLFNHGNWNIDGEFFWLYHKKLRASDFAKARTGHFRVGHNFPLSNGTVIEPAFMVSGFYGETGSELTGRDTVYDFGVNWYLDQTNYKFYLHYVKQDGDGSNLVHKEGVFHYGDYVGLGVTLQI